MADPIYRRAMWRAKEKSLSQARRAVLDELHWRRIVEQQRLDGESRKGRPWEHWEHLLLLRIGRGGLDQLSWMLGRSWTAIERELDGRWYWEHRLESWLERTEDPWGEVLGSVVTPAPTPPAYFYESSWSCPLPFSLKAGFVVAEGCRCPRCCAWLRFAGEVTYVGLPWEPTRWSPGPNPDPPASEYSQPEPQ